MIDPVDGTYTKKMHLWLSDKLALSPIRTMYLSRKYLPLAKPIRISFATLCKIQTISKNSWGTFLMQNSVKKNTKLLSARQRQKRNFLCGEFGKTAGSETFDHTARPCQCSWLKMVYKMTTNLNAIQRSIFRKNW